MFPLESFFFVKDIKCIYIDQRIQYFSATLTARLWKSLRKKAQPATTTHGFWPSSIPVATNLAYIPVAGLWRNSLGNTSIQHPLRIIFVLLLPSLQFLSGRLSVPRRLRTNQTACVQKLHTQSYIYFYRGRESICKDLIRPLCDFIGLNYIIYIIISRTNIL